MFLFADEATADADSRVCEKSATPQGAPAQGEAPWAEGDLRKVPTPLRRAPPLTPRPQTARAAADPRGSFVLGTRPVTVPQRGDPNRGIWKTYYGGDFMVRSPFSDPPLVGGDPAQLSSSVGKFWPSEVRIHSGGPRSTVCLGVIWRAQHAVRQVSEEILGPMQPKRPRGPRQARETQRTKRVKGIPGLGDLSPMQRLQDQDLASGRFVECLQIVVFYHETCLIRLVNPVIPWSRFLVTPANPWSRFPVTLANLWSWKFIEPADCNH